MDSAQTADLYHAILCKTSMPEWVERREDFTEGWAWARLEESLVQILVVVVIRQMRIFVNWCEQGYLKKGNPLRVSRS